jgi:hypothetical protein
MSKTIKVEITVSSTVHAQLAELIEYLEENIVYAVANTAEVPPDFTTMNASASFGPGV